MFKSYKVNVTSNMIIDPPTEKQVSYAKSISFVLNIDLPEKYTKESYSKFISENQEDYEEFLFYYGLLSIGTND